ncbi:RNA-splicing ligase RtcB [bacterium]|nr:MAG: RNA-splicing ligase RtcB [bacterium]
MKWEGKLEKIDEVRWRVPKKGGMRVPGIIYALPSMIDHILRDNTPVQVANVAHLPGIQLYSLAMPDIHWGYGFPIGGVAAMDMEEGVISPGGVGYDINCGVRVLRTDLTYDDIKKYLRQLLQAIYTNVPCGVGSQGKLRLSKKDLDRVLVKGSRWAVNNGFGWDEDLDKTEERGEMEGADPSAVSPRAKERGMPQLGTLGAGNHFLEIQVVEEIYDHRIAEVFGLKKGLVTVMIHCGSRGLGHQVCDDWVKTLGRAMQKYKINVPDRELASVPIRSPEGEGYLGAMKAAANFAWANRQIIMHWVRESFSKVLGKSPEELGMKLIYDVAHNIAKIEEHTIDGKKKTVCVHRKGATRAFPPGHPSLPDIYKNTGQPVLIPGDMGTNSYILVGTRRAMEETFGSTCHGAGRVLSRHQAIKATSGRNISKELEQKGILVMAKSIKTLREEVPDAYKDVDMVVEAVVKAGISKKVVKLRPIGVVKG